MASMDSAPKDQLFEGTQVENPAQMECLKDDGDVGLPRTASCR